MSLKVLTAPRHFLGEAGRCCSEYLFRLAKSPHLTPESLEFLFLLGGKPFSLARVNLAFVDPAPKVP